MKRVIQFFLDVVIIILSVPIGEKLERLTVDDQNIIHEALTCGILKGEGANGKA